MTRRKTIILALILALNAGRACWTTSAAATQAQAHGDYVVLLHGLIRSSAAMKRLEWAFEDRGYRVINVNYPSTELDIEDTAAITLDQVLRERITDPTAKVHFVTHSLGGIILREYLANHAFPQLGRVVMIAPPNHGSELVDKFKHWPFFRFFTGPAGQQLGTDPDSVPQQLGPAHFELGVIAGDRTLNPFYSWFIPGKDDGKVSVASTRLDGMDDFLVVHSSHTYLPWRKKVVTASLRFIADGKFADSSRPATTKPFQVLASPKMQAMR